MRGCSSLTMLVRHACVPTMLPDPEVMNETPVCCRFSTRYRHFPRGTRTSGSGRSRRSSLMKPLVGNRVEPTSVVNRFVLTDTGRVRDGTASPGGGRPEFRLDAVTSSSEKAENAAGYAARRALPL